MFKVIQKRKSKHDVRFDLPQIHTNHKRELFLCICMIAGMVIGIFCLKSNHPWSEKLSTLWDNYIYVKAGQSTVSDFFTTLCLKLLPLIAIYMTGLCAVGTPLLYAFPIGYGFVFGFLGASMYSAQMLKGIGYCALILYPGASLMGAALIYACSASIAMSGKLLKSLSPKGQAESANLRSYTLCFLTIAAISSAINALDILLYQMFSSYFQLS